MQGIGIGLNHAINTVDSWAGRLEIQSQVGRGTVVKIVLPKTKSPAWFVPEIKAAHGQTIVVIDDDESIHAVWSERFKPFQSHSIKLVHFHAPEKFIEWKNATKIDGSVIYLCDYEFINSRFNGVDLITQLKINYLSILVTSRVVNEVTARCEEHGIKFLPKDIAHIIPISLAGV